MSKLLNKKLFYTALFISFYQIISCIKQPYIGSFDKSRPVGFSGMESVLFAGMGAYISSSIFANMICKTFSLFERMRSDHSNTRLFDFFMTTITIFFSITSSLLFMTIFMRDKIFMSSDYLFIFYRLSAVIIVANFFIALITRHINTKGIGNGLWLINSCKYLQNVANSIHISANPMQTYFSTVIMLVSFYIIVNLVSNFIITVPIHALHSDNINLSNEHRKNLTQNYLEYNASKDILLVNSFISHLKHIFLLLASTEWIQQIGNGSIVRYLNGDCSKIVIICFMGFINWLYSDITINAKETQKNMTRQSIMIIGLRNDSTVKRLLNNIVMLNFVMMTVIQAILILGLSAIAKYIPYCQPTFRAIEIFILSNTMKNVYKQVRFLHAQEKPTILDYLRFRVR